MSFTPEHILSPDAVLRLFDLASPPSSSPTAAGQDLVLLVESKGTPIEGECVRKFEDGKKRLNAMGYMIITGLQVAPETGDPTVTTSDLIVVRQCDAASASIASLLKNKTHDVNVVLSTFKSGGDPSLIAQPTLEITIEKGRVAHFSVLTPSRLGGVPCEVITFAHQGFKINSAPQTTTGLRGAVRECYFATK